MVLRNIPGPKIAWWGGLILCLALAVSLMHLASVQSVEGAWSDLRFGLVSPARLPKAPKTVVIAIDDATLAESGLPLGRWEGNLARLITRIVSTHPAGIAVDLTSPADSLSWRDADRMAMAQAFAKASREEPAVWGLGLSENGHVIPPPHLLAAFVSQEHFGVAVLPQDADGAVRRFATTIPSGEHRNIPSLVGALLALQGLPQRDGVVDPRLASGITVLSARELLADETAHAALLRNAAVFIGGVFPDVDRIRNPVAANLSSNVSDTVPGVFMQALAYRSSAAPSGVHALSGWSWLSPLLMVALVVAFSYRESLRWSALLTLGLLAVTAVASFALLRYDLDLTLLPSLVVACALLLFLLCSHLISARLRRRRLERVFSGYVSKPLMGALLAAARDGRESAFDGVSRPLAFLFADLRGFTALSRERSPAAALALLNRFYAVVVPPIHAAGGAVDKFRGDGLMAFFGAPLPLANPSQCAFDAARGMLEALDALNTELAAEGDVSLRMGLGLAFGDAVLGNVGSAERHDYLVIGPAVNLAAHVQEHSKHTPDTPLLMTAEIWEQLDENRRAMTRSLRRCLLAKHGEMELYAFAR